MHEFFVAERLDQMDSLVSGEQAPNRLTNIGIEMHRVHQVDVWIAIRDRPQRAAERFERGAEALSTMRGDKNDSAARIEEWQIQYHLALKGHSKRIDDGVASHENPVRGNVFGSEAGGGA